MVKFVHTILERKQYQWISTIHALQMIHDVAVGVSVYVGVNKERKQPGYEAAMM